MIQRQFIYTTVKQFWSHLPKYIPLQKNGNIFASGVVERKYPNFISKGSSLVEVSTNCTFLTSSRNQTFIDLFTNNPYKRLYMPTVSINKLKVYEDITLPKLIKDPVINNIKIIDAPNPCKPVKKEAVRMILIRRRKMRKHKLRKLRKRMKFVFAKRKLKRELRKEQDFRTELLTQVEEADKFDAKAYVENILHTLRYQPKLETKEEIQERFRLLKKKNKYNTTFIRPKFDD